MAATALERRVLAEVPAAVPVATVFPPVEAVPQAEAPAAGERAAQVERRGLVVAAQDPVAREEAAAVAVKTVSDFLAEETSIKEVIFVLFDEKTYDVYATAIAGII